MAALQEDDAWKCYKHPSRRRRTGVCPTCLRDRLIGLCPNCANSLPCPCFSALASTSSSSSSSSFSRFSVDSSAVGAIGRVSSLIESEPSFRRSRSAAVPFLSSRFSGEDGTRSSSRRKPLLWSVFGIFKNKEVIKSSDLAQVAEDEQRSMALSRSKSVSVWRSSESGKVPKAGSNKGWHFPSPMKVFRQSKPRSPLYRG
uniref:Uncharacterized protein n=1 Tax=Kalanchoe fedtschenkoi TaxID=63787 RepID=A0A7N0VEY9_KALFE